MAKKQCFGKCSGSSYGNKLDYMRCILLLKEHNTPKNIFLHSRKVNAIAKLIASKLIEKGIDINLELVDFASLLHDIAKFNTLNDRNISHTLEGGKILDKSGFKTIANVVAKHGLYAVLNGKLETWEEKIVNYADKRVKHDELVSIEERLREGAERYKDIYPDAEKRITSTLEPLKKLEKEIFNKLDIKPEDITEEAIKPFLMDDAY